MAANGGGSWKVAYADFVTAMMAFFLVMWIGAQDQKTRQSVANYFVDPSGVDKKPARTGATFDSTAYGNMPSEQGSALSKGRDSYSQPAEFSPATKVVADWLVTDTKARRVWLEKARACREAAARAPEVADRTVTLEQAAAAKLGAELRTVAADAATRVPPGVHQDLLLWAMSEVNWVQVSEDLLGR